MKNGAPNHPKMTDLATRLQVPRYSAVGLVEMLIHTTQKYAPGGDIGRFSNAAIAHELEWDGDPGILVGAFMDARWLDPCDHPWRLLVHEWPEHATDAVHLALARAGRKFADGTMPNLTRLSKAERAKAEEAIARNTHCVATAHAPPSPPLPFPGLPSPAEPRVSFRAGGNGAVWHPRAPVYPLHVAAGVVALYPRHRVGTPRTAATSVQGALERIAANEDHPGHADPLQWLLGRVTAYERSPVGRSGFAMSAVNWFDGDGFDAHESAWVDMAAAPDVAPSVADIKRKLGEA